MANKYLKRKFTLRESILLIVLVVVLFLGLYFGLVYYPISTRTSELNADRARTDDQITVYELQKREYDDMKKKLAEIEAGKDTAEMPKYDKNNQSKVLIETFNEIFDGVVYGMTGVGSASSPRDGVRTRTVSFEFTVTNENKGETATVYEKVRSLLTALMTTPYRSHMSSFTLKPGSAGLQESESIEVNCTMFFYELDS